MEKLPTCGQVFNERTRGQERFPPPPLLHVDDDVHEADEEEGESGGDHHERNWPEISYQTCLNLFHNFGQALLYYIECRFWDHYATTMPLHYHEAIKLPRGPYIIKRPLHYHEAITLSLGHYPSTGPTRSKMMLVLLRWGLCTLAVKFCIV